VQLPPNLRSLRLWSGFREPLAALRLPASLTAMHIGRNFNHPLPALEHTSLLKLKEMRGWRGAVAALRFPPSLHTLVFPPMKHLDAKWNACFLSSRITHLDFITAQSSYDYRAELKEVHWPPLLRKISFGWNWRTPLTAADWTPPSSVVELHLPLSPGWQKEEPVNSLSLPPSLEVLHLTSRVSLCELQLPSTLRELHLGAEWDLPVAELPPLPPKLDTLAFGRDFDQPVADLQLPATLRSLIFGNAFNQPLHQLRLPSGLRHFALRAYWTHHLEFASEIGPCRFDQPADEYPRWPEGMRVFEAPEETIKFCLDTEQLAISLPTTCAVHATTDSNGTM
jgi:hypothetical protein